MSERTPIFRKIDEVLFRQVDAIKETNPYSKVSELLGNLDEEPRNILNQVATIILLLIPTTLLLLFFYSNFSLRRNIQSKTEILELANFLKTQRAEVESGSRRIFRGNAIKSKNELSNKLKGILSASGVDLNNIHLANFEINESIKGLGIMESDLKFDKLTLMDFASLLEALTQKEKMSVLNIEVERIEASKLLKGNLRVKHLGKSTKTEG
ncbi:MAG: hypothetical protein HOE90_18445 [Bacteriovoracaceae bacterium]|jgi:hypothetical protein|nr:hypothetical protein [Bacteriovoracaceae bacterium]